MLRSSVRYSTTLALVLAAGLFAGNTFADVYKYTDEKGNVHYTDKPKQLPAERLSMQSRRTDEEAVQQRTQDYLSRTQENFDSQAKRAAERGEQQAAAELSAKDKAERCTKARERYDTYMNSQRLYRAGQDGEREYLSDAELDSARNAARISMEELCK